MNQPTDEQLKRALIAMLPAKLIWEYSALFYRDNYYANPLRKVLDTELLHLCWLVEETIERKYQYFLELIPSGNGAEFRCLHSSWQQRVIALAKVKNVEIV